MTFSVVSYGAAAAAYSLLTLLLVVSRRAGRDSVWVLVAVAGMAVWGAAIAANLFLADSLGARPAGTVVADALRTMIWVWCLLGALPGGFNWRSIKGVLGAVSGLLVVFTVAMTLLGWSTDDSNLTLLALAIIGCLTIEQILRNSTLEQKRTLKPFLWTIGAILVYDVFTFSDAALFDALDARLWAPRGLLAALAVPVLVLSAKRHPDWAQTLFVSRDIVFYSATLTGVGMYLVAMAVGGFVIRERGGEWGGAIQFAYLVAALAVLASVLSSTRLKLELRVFISKHFFRNRYDYRDQWLRLTRMLSDSTQQELPLDQRSIKALCTIIDGGGGQLWLDRGGRSVFEPLAAWQAPFPVTEYTAESALVRFLRETQWVIDTRQYADDPEHYQHAFRDDPIPLPADSLIVPLIHQNDMLGIARLDCHDALRELNYEDHDLLKTAGRQIAAFLAHDLARERLSETRQFEAFNRLSAFVMHDIKNLLAQQALLVNNAKRFRDRPEFVDDVIRTVESGVQRMRKLLRQLEQGALLESQQRIDLGKLILRAVSSCADESNVRCTVPDRLAVWVRGNPEQLSSVMIHIIQNAQEASTKNGVVTVSLIETAGDRALIEVQDNGHGMSEEFIRLKMFKPFETTKGSSGMGIGAYQAREVVRALGGELSVTSEVGKGTRVRIMLPLEPQASEAT